MSTQSDEVKFAVMQNDLTYIKEKIRDIDDKVSSSYVSKEEYEPVKRIVYGLVGIIMVAVVGAMLSLVVR